MLIKSLELQPLQEIDNMEIGQKINLLIGQNRISCTVLKIDRQNGGQSEKQIKNLGKTAGRLKGKGYFAEGGVAFQREARDN